MVRTEARGARDRFPRRAGLLFTGFLLAIGGVFARCAWLTMAEAQVGEARQSRYSLASEWIPARRGVITDARGLVLARDVSRWIIAIDPWAASGRLAGKRILEETPEQFEANCPERIRCAWEELLALEGFEPLADPDEILRRLLEDQDPRSRRQFRAIGSVETVAAYERFLAHRREVHRTRGSTFPMPREETRREYPLGGLGIQVVGDRSAKGTPYFGVEERYAELLAGRRGIEVAQVDGIGRVRYAVPSEEAGVRARPGADLDLTLEAPAQIALECILRETLERTEAQMVTGVILDPHTGGIIAAASVPTCARGEYGRYYRQERDPDAPPGSESALRTVVDPEAFDVQLMASLFPMEPGSMMKPLVVGRALDRGVARLSDPVHVVGTVNYKSYGRARRRYTDTHELGDRTVRGALIESSNAGIAEVGTKLGEAELERLLLDFGFGSGTGFDLREANGRIPGQRGAPPWNDHTTLSIPIGYELLVTPLQIARAYCAIANGGVLVTPHVVARVGGEPRSDPAGERVFTEETSRQLREVLREAVVRGTGKGLDADRIRLAGKTGTAAHYSKSGQIAGWYTSSFAGFAPAEAPRYVAVVTVERPGGDVYYASKTAAPAVLEILQALLDDGRENRFRSLLADALAGSREEPMIPAGLDGEDGRWGTPSESPTE